MTSSQRIRPGRSRAGLARRAATAFEAAPGGERFGLTWRCGRPAEGWPAGAFGAQGTITPIESGYYQPRLRRVDGAWRIFHHTILLDQPLVLPGT
ncbi:hypothetical protein ACIOHS_19250 [Streptomyces sp. NPDC088253]|uniref:hypothetical protein n=1 Tax=Streptomyces sp. NPDC088253 TaxID=3365846 RepID=UPI0038187BB2